MHVAKHAGDQRRRPAPVAGRRRTVENRENAPAGLGRISRLSAAIAGLVQAGKPGESLLWKMVASDEMPPKEPLPPAEREVLKRWIEATQ